jgi:hypothetical protein
MTVRAPTWVLCSQLLLGVVHAGQVCDTRTHALSSPNERFTDHRDGTVTDEVTQLMWMRCAVGQTWREGGCAGDALRLGLVQARSHAEGVNRDGSAFFNDWRVPSLRELATVSERQCREPRINLRMFPATPSAPFWTSTARPGQDRGQFVLDFGSEGVSHTDPAQPHHLRLVRTAP